MNLVDRAMLVAKVAHIGQIDKTGAPYFEHCLAVAGMVEGEEARAAALLHDTVEDTPVSLHDLIELGFPAPVVDAVRLLTHVHGISPGTYLDHIRAIRDATTPGAEIAKTVKLADMRHNSDPARALPKDHGWLKKRYDDGRAILTGEKP